MSILNQTNDGLFNVLVVLVRVLVRFGPRSREDLLTACGSEFEAVESSMLGQTLTRWTALGLFGSSDGSVVLLDPHRSILGKSADEAEARLPKVAAAIALAPANNERFWEAEASKSADLSRGVAWMLAQDIYSLDPSTDALGKLETHQLASKGVTIVQNNTRWNGLRTWMSSLGFARPGSTFSVDPTSALGAVLPELFDGADLLPAPTFVERAAGLLPVLDGGAYRREVEGVLNEQAWTRPPEGRLSTSLSRALQRLDREGAITLEAQSDIEGSHMLVGAHQRLWREITHVRLNPVKKAR